MRLGTKWVPVPKTLCPPLPLTMSPTGTRVARGCPLGDARLHVSADTFRVVTALARNARNVSSAPFEHGQGHRQTSHTHRYGKGEGCRQARWH